MSLRKYTIYYVGFSLPLICRIFPTKMRGNPYARCVMATIYYWGNIFITVGSDWYWQSTVCSPRRRFYEPEANRTKSHTRKQIHTQLVCNRPAFRHQQNLKKLIKQDARSN